tara:strand:+ start:197 stop:715 length:519 start_codon:yes stop_codon:yes gene_type:complete
MKKFECCVDTTKLRASNGVMKTEGLFWERAAGLAEKNPQRPPPTPVYTLKDYDHNGYPSMYLLYMECATEYEAALRLLGSWRHWKKLSSSKFFLEFLTEWREERKLAEESMARTTILESIIDGNVSAAKTILDEGKRKIAGRPSTDEVTGELKAAAREQDALHSIVTRMEHV